MWWTSLYSSYPVSFLFYRKLDFISQHLLELGGTITRVPVHRMREEVSTPVPSVAPRDFLGCLHGFPPLQMQRGGGPKKSHCNGMNAHSHTLDCADSHTHIFIVRSHCDIDIVITVVSRNTEGWGLIRHFWKQTKQIPHDPFFNSYGEHLWSMFSRQEIWFTLSCGSAQARWKAQAHPLG